MKRRGHIWEEMLSDENIKKAIKEVNRSHRWRRYPDKPNKKVLWIDATTDDRIKELRQIIENGFVPSECRKKKRYDANAKKWRDICEPKLWPDQYVHHIVIQAIEKDMMKGMDKWCCGSIKGRGTHYGIKAIKKWMNDEKKTRYCAELDIYHFYDSLQPKVVMDRMRHLIKDRRVLDLIWRIIENGIQIGSYCSQWFANTVLQELDHKVRESGIKVTHYLRYMDNFTIFARSKRELRKTKKLIDKWLKEHHLSLKPNWQIFKAKARMPNALGYRFSKGHVLIRKHSLLRAKRQLRTYYKLYESGKEVPLKMAQGLLSRLGAWRWCDSRLLYERFYRPKTQRKLKKIVRSYQKKEASSWNTLLEQFKEETVAASY